MTSWDEDSGVVSVSISALRALLDEALFAVTTIETPSVAARDAASALEEAIGHVYAALTSRSDYERYGAHVTAASACTRAALEKLQEAMADDPTVGRALDLAARALRRMQKPMFLPASAELSLPSEPGAHDPAVPASVGEPRLLVLRRGVLKPAIPLSSPPVEPPPDPPPPPPQPPLSMDELLALAASLLEKADAPPKPPEKKPDPRAEPLPPLEPIVLERMLAGEALTEEDVIWERARSCLEDMSVFGSMRRPIEIEGNTWTGRARPEERLLARVDALTACPDWVYPRLVSTLADQPLPDPEMTWAVVFAFGTLAGDDASDQVVRLLRTADLEDERMVERVADVASLVPNIGVERILADWIGDPLAARRRIAILALARRDALPVATAVAATADLDVGVAEAGARALARALGPVSASTFALALGRRDPKVLRAAMVSATARGIDAGYRRAQEILAEGRGALGDAALIAAIAGDPGIWRMLDVAADLRYRRVIVEAIGWLGAIDAVPKLIELLERTTGDGAANAIASALQRLTGASLCEEDLEPEYEPGREPFTEGFVVDDDDAVVLVTEPEPWHAWWRRWGRRARPGIRYRAGAPWTPLASVREMSLPWAKRRDRVLGHLELVARTGSRLGFDPDAFVVRQQSQIDACRRQASLQVDSLRGTWSTKLRFA